MVRCRLLAIALLLAVGTVSAGTYEDPLVGVWHLDEGAGAAVFDATDRENDGEVHGGEWVDGPSGKALRLDGKDDYVSLPGLDALREATIELWVKAPAPAEARGPIVCFGRPHGGRSDAAILGYGIPGAAVGVPSLGACVSEWVSASSAATLPTGEWCHLAGVFSIGGLRLYVNGRLTAASDAWKRGLPPHEAILLGAGSWGTHLACSVDEVRLYRKALPDDEIARHAADRRYLARPPQPAARRPSLRANVSAADFYSPDSPTSGIQKAVDALPARGGVVHLPPGTYLLRRSVSLRSGVTLRGSGSSTVLKRGPQARSLLTAPSVVGSTSVAVEDTSGFAAGDEIALLDRKLGGWYTTHARLTRIEGKSLHFETPVVRAYDPANGAVAVNYFPGILLDRKRGVTIEDLAIDGDIARNPGPESDFTLAAIHIVSSRDCVVRNCTVTRWPSDGVGVQGGSGNRVVGCTVDGCRGHGFHPGTGVRSSLFANNIARRNAWDGLYFCMGCRHVVVSDSVFEENGWNGIGGLGNGGDCFNVVTGNVCVRNGESGILANDGEDNTITGNICYENSTARAGAHPGIRLHDVRGMTVSGNRCTDAREQPTQTRGIEETGTSDGNLVTGNHCRGCTAGGVRLLGGKSLSANNLE